MGVKDLWQLLAPVGRRVSIETLEGKVVAVDVSIWITQFVKAMRDDDGEMIKNAHLIGTIRRILRLLYHRIKPIFVFDGATPLLKLQTVRSRRAVRDKQENNKRTIAQKIFLSQMKQRAIQLKLAAKKAEAVPDELPHSTASNQSSSSNGRFSSTFSPLDSTPSKRTETDTNPEDQPNRSQQILAAPEVSFVGESVASSSSRRPLSTDESISKRGSGGRLRKGNISFAEDTKGDENQSSSTQETRIRLSSAATVAAASALPDSDDDDDFKDVQWVDGYENLRGKRLKGSAGDGSDEDDEDDGEMHWNIPENSAEIDVEVLASLPAHLRKNMIEDARRRERRRSRNSYIPVAANPELYSQTQLANFLKGSKLNKRIYEAQKMAEGGAVGEEAVLGGGSKISPMTQAKGRTIASEGGKKYVMIRATQSQAQAPMQAQAKDKEKTEKIGAGEEKKMAAHSGDDGEQDLPQRRARRVIKLDDDENENDDDDKVEHETGRATLANPSKSLGGGFLIDEDEEGHGGGFLVDDDEGDTAGSGGFLVDNVEVHASKEMSSSSSATSGGFIVDEDSENVLLSERKETTAAPSCDAEERPGWSCSECTYNNAVDAEECLLCGNAAPPTAQFAIRSNANNSSSGSSSNISSSSQQQSSMDGGRVERMPDEADVVEVLDETTDGWACATCTLINALRLTICEACGSSRDGDTTATTSQAALANSFRSLPRGALGEAAFSASTSPSIRSLPSSTSKTVVIGTVATTATTAATPTKRTIIDIANELNTLDDSEPEEGGDEFDDVAWESADEDKPSPPLKHKTGQPIAEDKADADVDADEIVAYQDNRTAAVAAAATISVDYSRAINTAGRMADWAGRAVQRALMEHMKMNPSQPQDKTFSEGKRSTSRVPPSQGSPPAQIKAPMISVAELPEIQFESTSAKSLNATDVTTLAESTHRIKEFKASSDVDMSGHKVIDHLNDDHVTAFGADVEDIEILEDHRGDDFSDDENIGYGDSIAAIDKSELQQLQVGAAAFTLSSIASPSASSSVSVSASAAAQTQAQKDAQTDSDSWTDTKPKSSPAVDVAELERQLREEEHEELVARRARKAALRDAETMTDEMRDDLMHLLNAFGLPYLVAPFEAEAQCAVLEELNLVDGIITEDSDAFLFGAQTVYKNIFSDKKFVEVYLAADIKKELGLQREELVALAFFLGSDYTEGVTGVGIVNAVEIVQAFPMRFIAPSKEECSQDQERLDPSANAEDQEEDEESAVPTRGPIEGLKKFRKWLEGYDFADTVRAKQVAKKTTPKKNDTPSEGKKRSMKTHAKSKTGRQSKSKKGKRSRTSKSGTKRRAAGGAAGASDDDKSSGNVSGSDSDFVDDDEDQSGYSEAEEVHSGSDDGGRSSAEGEADDAETAVGDVTRNNDEGEDEQEETKLVMFSEKHKGARARWSVKQNFPDPRVAEAYLKPNANRDATKFEWPLPKLHRIRDYCREILGWTENELDAQIDPVIQRYTAKSHQTRIDSYFYAYEDDQRFAKIASTRLRDAVVKKTAKKRTDIAAPKESTPLKKSRRK